jgi:inhibitor of the pro-sigma K processing machinery
MRVLLRIGLRFILGVLVIFLLDLAAGNSVWSLGLNPGSALVVGLLGLPGLVFLGLLKMFFLV